MSHKLGICIPYRNRKEHLERLTSVLGEYLNRCGIDHKFYVGHQVDDKSISLPASGHPGSDWPIHRPLLLRG